LTGPVSVGEELPTIQAEQELRADLAEIDEDLHRLDQVIDRARKEEKDLEETGESVLGTDK